MVPEILDILFYKQSHTLKTKLLQGLNTWRSIKTKQKKLLTSKIESFPTCCTNCCKCNILWLSEGGIGIFGFGYFLDRFFSFCCKRLSFFGFGGHCGLRIFRFLASGFRFSWKILAVFQFWYPMWFLVFGRAESFNNRLLFWVSVYYHIKP